MFSDFPLAYLVFIGNEINPVAVKINIPVGLPNERFYVICNLAGKARIFKIVRLNDGGPLIF